jgi:hypothetical protein
MGYERSRGERNMNTSNVSVRGYVELETMVHLEGPDDGNSSSRLYLDIVISGTDDEYEHVHVDPVELIREYIELRKLNTGKIDKATEGHLRGLCDSIDDEIKKHGQ